MCMQTILYSYMISKIFKIYKKKNQKKKKGGQSNIELRVFMTNFDLKTITK